MKRKLDQALEDDPTLKEKVSGYIRPYILVLVSFEVFLSFFYDKSQSEVITELNTRLINNKLVSSYNKEFIFNKICGYLEIKETINNSWSEIWKFVVDYVLLTLVYDTLSFYYNNLSIDKNGFYSKKGLFGIFKEYITLETISNCLDKDILRETSTIYRFKKLFIERFNIYLKLTIEEYPDSYLDRDIFVYIKLYQGLYKGITPTKNEEELKGIRANFLLREGAQTLEGKEKEKLENILGDIDADWNR